MVVDGKYLPVIESCIRQIEKEYCRLYWNENQKKLEYSPIYNTGAKIDFDNFYIHAYNWDEETGNDKPNFKYKTLEVTWYKHLGRGNYATIEEELNIEFLSTMLEECFNEMNNKMDLDDPYK